jgi:hypothetical protein
VKSDVLFSSGNCTVSSLKISAFGVLMKEAMEMVHYYSDKAPGLG